MAGSGGMMLHCRSTTPRNQPSCRPCWSVKVRELLAPLALFGSDGLRHCTDNGHTLVNVSDVRRDIATKEKGFVVTFVTTNPDLYWCRRDESNTRPSHYE